MKVNLAPAAKAAAYQNNDLRPAPAPTPAPTPAPATNQPAAPKPA